MQLRWLLLCFLLTVVVLEVSCKRGGGRTRLKVAPSTRQHDTRRRKDKNRNQYAPPTAPPPPPPLPAPKPAKPAPKPQPSAPVGPPAPAPVPSAPVMPNANKPNQPLTAQNYPQQSATNPNFQQQGAPPAYQSHAVPPAGAPPAYSPHGSPPAYPSNVAPPAYSPHGTQPAGFQPNGAPPAYQGPHMGFQAPATGQHGASVGHGAPGYGQQPHGYPTNQGYPAGHNAPAGYPAGYGSPAGYPAGYGSPPGYPAGHGVPSGYPAGYGAPGGYPAGYGNPGGYVGAGGLGAAHGFGGGYGGSHGGGLGGLGGLGGYGSQGYGGYGKQKHGSSMLSNAGLLLTGAAVGALAHRGFSGGFGHNRNSYFNRQQVLSCPEYDFKTLADCCETLPERLFSDEAMLACNNNTRDEALFTVAKHYIMNKIQNPIDADSLMVKDTPQACFTKCLFKNQNLLSEDNTIDYDAASTYFVSRVDSSWQSVVSSAVTSCKTSIPIGITNETLYAPAECDNAPGFLLQCIRRKLLRYCPGDKLDKSYKCVQNMYVLRKCNAFWNTIRKDEPMIGNGTDIDMGNSTMMDNTTLTNGTTSEDYNGTMSDSSETTTEKITTIIIPSTLKPRVSYSIEEIERMLAGGPPPTKTPPTTETPTTVAPISPLAENATMEAIEMMGNNSTTPIVIGEFKPDRFNMTMDQMLLELSDFDDED